MDDNGGQWPKWVKKAVAAVAVVAVVATAAVVVSATGGAALAPIACALKGAAVGAATGMASGAVSGAVTGAVTHRLTTGSWKGAGQAALDGAADGALSGAVTGAITGGIKSPFCFIAGTAIVTAAGYVAIENITEGDVVFAWNETTDEVELKRVVETYVNETDELIHLYVNGEKISTTPSHPFYSPVKGWTDAVNLRAGDMLVLVNGEYVVLEKVQHEILESPIAVYNFQVEDDHTYYVGESGILVHNACKPSKQETFLPDEYYTRNASKLGTPNTKINHYKYNPHTKLYEKSTVFYDIGGRQNMRIDWTNHGRINHTNPHIHYTQYNALYPLGRRLPRW